MILFWAKFWNWTFFYIGHQLTSSFSLIYNVHFIWCLLYCTVIIIVIANIRLITTIQGTLEAFENWFLNMKLLSPYCTLKQYLLFHIHFIYSPPCRLPTLVLSIKMNLWHYFTHYTMLIAMATEFTSSRLWALSLHLQPQIMRLRRFGMLKIRLCITTHFLIGGNLSRPIWITCSGSTIARIRVWIILVISKLDFDLTSFVSPFRRFIELDVVKVLFIIFNYLVWPVSSNLFHLKSQSLVFR